MAYIARQSKQGILELSKSFPALLITGPGQACKTIMLKELDSRNRDCVFVFWRRSYDNCGDHTEYASDDGAGARQHRREDRHPRRHIRGNRATENRFAGNETGLNAISFCGTAPVSSSGYRLLRVLFYTTRNLSARYILPVRRRHIFFCRMPTPP